ncbi:phosphotransferase enzyme family protein [Eudoraea chungangensis]|uniref:phosphotransferase enzyme family protein n=1 Tax=Eudoraea chungangensis TaxID=1481905 RepID=UPI0023EC0522|nr:aminoglycoside phosphotransferase family protein [Eudoraea chungangensis]
MHKADLHFIVSHFELDEVELRFREINQGYINSTFFIIQNEVPKFVLQRINNEVFPDIDIVMANMSLALKYLVGKGYSQISLVKTKKNQNFLTLDDGSHWRIITAILNCTAYSTTQDRTIAFEAGKTLGRFHSLMQKASEGMFRPSLPNFHDLAFREVEFLDAMKFGKNSGNEVARNAIDFAKINLGKLKKLQPLDLPKRICHNDTKLNNILFDKDLKTGLCLIDLDTIMPGYFYYDFGDIIRTLVNPAEEDERDLSKIRFETDQFTACILGLSEEDPLLSTKEINSLPYGVVLMPFLHGLRALTDYLNGNVYYKVSYENQNLDRCLSLFKFTELSFENYEIMLEIIKDFYSPK